MGHALETAFGPAVRSLEVHRGEDERNRKINAVAHTERQRISLSAVVQEDLTDHRSMEILAHEVSHALASAGPRQQTLDQPGDPGEAAAKRAGSRFGRWAAEGAITPPPLLEAAHGGLAVIHRQEAVPVSDASAPPPSSTVAVDPASVVLTYGPNARALTAEAELVVKGLLASAGQSAATINSTKRSPEDQARAMYTNLEAQGASAQRELYGAAGDKVIDAYEQAKRDGKTGEEVQAAMVSKINELGPGKVSNHCAEDGVEVVDLSPASISDREAFVTSVTAAQGDGTVTEFLHPGNSNDPAFHIVFQP